MAKLRKESKPRPLEGIWSYRDIIGSTVSLSSLPVVSAYRQHMLGASRSQNLKIEDVVFRVSRDGKILPLYKLEGIEEYYSSNVLNIFCINSILDKAAFCGQIKCKETLCGRKCESVMYDINELLGLIPNSVTIVNDDSSVVVKQRTINFVGATVEDPDTDTDDITKIEINFKGDILD